MCVCGLVCFFIFFIFIPEIVAHSRNCSMIFPSASSCYSFYKLHAQLRSPKPIPFIYLSRLLTKETFLCLQRTYGTSSNLFTSEEPTLTISPINCCPNNLVLPISKLVESFSQFSKEQYLFVLHSIFTNSGELFK